MNIEILERKASAKRQGKRTVGLPSGRIARTGDVLDTEAHGVSESTAQRWIDGKMACETTAEPTLHPQITTIEKSVRELEAHKAPSKDWTNDALREFLDVHDIDYTSRDDKAELLSKALAVGTGGGGEVDDAVPNVEPFGHG